MQTTVNLILYDFVVCFYCFFLVFFIVFTSIGFGWYDDEVFYTILYIQP